VSGADGRVTGMASRASNFCIDASDPYTQTMWWAKVLEDFTIEDD
jgi:hypothetical protein